MSDSYFSYVESQYYSCITVEADLGETDIVLVWNMCTHYSGSTHTDEPHKLKPSRSKIYTNTSFHYPKVKVKTETIESEVTDKTDK